MNTEEYIRHDWTKEEIMSLMELPFNDLLFQAHTIHREFFDPNEIQMSQLVSIKTGGCPEDCGYCSQSSSAKSELVANKLMDMKTFTTNAKQAKENGATRYCMGAAWRSPKNRDMNRLKDMIKVVSDLGLESCATLGMLNSEQAEELAKSGLDYYNHNIDTSEEFYDEIITTRCFQDRLDTLETVRKSGMKVCCGGIIGMGETDQDRASMFQTLANLEQHPESVPVNQLIAVTGTKLEDTPLIDPIDFVRCICVARILMPQSAIRLSAGREEMSDEMQALCFFSGANSIFIGDQLLTKGNPAYEKDEILLKKLGVYSQVSVAESAPNN